MDRRDAIAFIAGATAGLSRTAYAQAWPAQPIRIVTPTPVGVGTDLFARAYAEALSKSLKTPVIVDNRPGAAGMLGTDAVAKSPPNGYTLLLSTSLPFTTVPHLFAKVPYSAQKDFVPVAQLYRGGSFIIAGNYFAGKSLKETVALAKAAPGSVSYASYGPGSTAHLGMELLQDAAGVQLLHVPYKQSAMTDVVSGQVQLGFEPPASALPQVNAGKVRALAYTGERRSPALPDVPTLAELYPGLEVFTWVGAWVPVGTPDMVVARLHDAFLAAAQSSDVQRLLADTGAETMTTPTAQMAGAIARESEAMGRLIRAKNITISG